jgi:hypothetical protein
MIGPRTERWVWRELLWERLSPGGRIAEIGVQWGFHACQIAFVARPAELVLIDPWRFIPGAYEADGSDVAQAEQDRRHDFVAARLMPGMRIVRATAHEAVGQFADGYFDAVYLDACHLIDNVRQDLRDWWPKVKPGGMFGGHDYYNVNAPHIQVRPAVDEWCQQIGRTLDIITIGHCGSWALWK